MEFWLGVHQPHWLATAGVPLFVSDRRMRHRKTLPRAAAPWCLDSGAFSELRMFGKFQSTVTEYVDRIERYKNEIGLLRWAAPQDWMCESFMLKATGLTVRQHQLRTIVSVVELRTYTNVYIPPVLQGWTLDDYLHHVDLYAQFDVDLTQEPIVGLGGVCRRQGTTEMVHIFRTLAVGLNIKLHGFGVKTKGIEAAAKYMVSADSMAWSFAARRAESPLLYGHAHTNCANCLRYALHWRRQLLRKCL